jgi:predicted ArsR family transcriptional regulator
MHYNTTKEKGRSLRHYRAKAETQDEQILEYFRRHPSRLASPSQLLESVFANRIPVTSVRRALSTLTTSSKLIKTDRKVTGLYGRPEYLWRLQRG